MTHDKWLLYSGAMEMTITELKILATCPDDVSPELKKRTEDHDVHWTIQWETDFHYKLLLIKSKPYIIYYMGNLDLLQQPILWIVGPRHHSAYAREVLDRLFSLAPQYHFITVSGLAPGVDQLCHTMSIAKWIPTIAVLWWGLKYFLNTPDRHLIRQIVDGGGLVMSEFKLDQEPQNYTFPQRNRIIAGLSDVLFLPEAGEKSGSLITANFALEMHKPVYGVPSSIFSPQSAGLHQLISSWAIKAVTDIQQFLDTCFTPKTSTCIPVIDVPDLSPDEQSLLSLLGEQNISNLNDLLSAGSRSASELIWLLTLLEMKKCIYQEAPGVYRRSV